MAHAAPASAGSRDKLTAEVARLAESLGLRGKVRITKVEPGLIEAELVQDDATADELTQLPPPVVGPERYSTATEGQAALAAEAQRWELESCANPDGAELEVPFGSFSGAGLVGVTDEDKPYQNAITGEVHRIKTRTLGLGQLGERSLTHGWDFEPGAMLYSVITPMLGKDVPNGNDPADPDLWTTCEAVQRFVYVGPSGRYTFIAAKPDIVHVDPLPSPSPSDCWQNLRHGFYEEGVDYVSTDGHAILSGSRIVFSDGHVEEFRTPASGKAHHPFNIGLTDHIGSPTLPEYLFFVGQLMVLDRTIDANGNVLDFQYDGNDWVEAVVDPHGRRTAYVRDGEGRVDEIHTPGIGGKTDVYDLVWQRKSYRAREAFADAIAADSNGYTVVDPRLEYTTLSELRLPDGRSWRFEYGAWGNPTRVHRPSGAIEELVYGDASTFSWAPPGSVRCPNAWDALRKRRVTERRTLPLGDGGPVYTTKIVHDPAEVFPTPAPQAFGPNYCESIYWITTTTGEGEAARHVRQGLCDSYNLRGLDGRVVVQEVRDSEDRLLEATYFGDPETGELFVEFELALDYHSGGTPILGADAPILDVRHTKIVHERDGVRTTELLDYDVASYQARGTTDVAVPRTRGNVVRHELLGPDGVSLRVTETAYFDDADYLERNLVRLPTRTTISDESGTLSQTEWVYDEGGNEALARSNTTQPRRVAVADARGNATTKRMYIDADESIVSRVEYYDNGAPHRAAGGRAKGDLDGDFTTTTTGDFEACSDSHPVSETTTTSAVPGNGAAAPHVSITRSDCWTGAVLSETAVDGALTCHRYDDLGRTIETAGPGDALRADTAGVSDPLCDPNGNAAGPSVITEYDLAIDSNGQSIPSEAHVTTIVKNGAAGRRTVSFADGLGRSTAVCTEVDPELSEGNEASCVLVEYDFRDLAVAKSVPFWVAELPTQVPDLAADTRRLVREYDALGRETSSTLEGSGLGSVLTEYASDGGAAWVATVTDRSGNTKSTFFNALGYAIAREEVWEDVDGGLSQPCTDNLCTTTMRYDGLGRLLSVTEDGQSTPTTTYGHDWLGRRVWIVDADMGGFARHGDAKADDPTGRWSFRYDEHGNEIERIDPAGNSITLEYDALDRLVRKSIPSAVAGDDDERVTTWYFDGAGPPVPQ